MNKYLIIAIVFLSLTTFIGYLKYENNILENENKELVVSLEVTKEELSKTQKTLKDTQQFSKELSKIVNEEKLKAQDLQTKLNKFEKSVDKIAERHPKMLNNILNKATKSVNDCFEVLSKGGECEK
jgi:chromosome segregation ATPase